MTEGPVTNLTPSVPTLNRFASPPPPTQTLTVNVGSLSNLIILIPKIQLEVGSLNLYPKPGSWGVISRNWKTSGEPGLNPVSPAQVGAPPLNQRAGEFQEGGS